MITTILILVICHICAAVVFFHLANAPEGCEDDQGFRYGTPPTGYPLTDDALTRGPLHVADGQRSPAMARVEQWYSNGLGV